MDTKNGIDVSVIVPIYNVEEYLEECLESIHNQTKDNLEVIMVDDGSTDSSAEIAKKFEEKYNNFHLYQKQNGGLGNARNYGIKFAKGKYIGFVDSDDIINPEMYKYMYKVAEKNNSDFAICNVVRIKGGKTSISSLHNKIFSSDLKQKTHITESPILINDTISCNKLILKSFWDEHNFKFPEGILYEDIPVTIPMHFLANNVSVVQVPGYYWRIRDGVSKSITQNTGNLKNIKDRLHVLTLVNEFFDKNNFGKEKRELMHIKSLKVDLMIFVNQCKNIIPEIANQMIKLVKEYIEKNIDISILTKLSIIEQQKYQYVLEENLSKLIDVLNYQYSTYYIAPVSEKEGKFFVSLPNDLFTIDNRDITQELKEINPRRVIDNIEVENENIIVTGNIFLPRVNINKHSDQSIKVYLYNNVTQYKKKLNVEPYITPNFSDKYGYIFDKETGEQSQYNYDGTGFKINIDLEEIDIESLEEGTYKILIEYKNRVLEGASFIAGATNSIKKNSRLKTFIKNETVARITFSPINELQLYISKKNVFASNLYFRSKTIACECETPVKSVFAKCEEDQVEIPFYRESDSKFAIEINLLENSKVYNIYAVISDNEKPVLVMNRKRRFKVCPKEKYAGFMITSKAHYIKFTIEECSTQLQETSVHTNIATIITSTVGNSQKLNGVENAHLCINNKFTGKLEKIAKANTIKLKDNSIICKFSIDFSDNNVNKNFYEGYKNIFIVYSKGKEKQTHRIYYEKYFKHKFLFDTLSIEYFRSNEGFLRFHFLQKWPEEEDNVYKRRALMFENYPKFREEPINPKRIVFSSMWGTKYSCNPQHLYEYIDKNYPDYECIWVFKDQRMPISGNAIRVRQESLKYYYYMATAKYFVNNVNFNEDYIKREGQIELQTMHGTPLKTLGLDVVADFPTEISREKYIEKNSRWNYLLSQGEFVKDKAYSMFRFDKEILKTGYPRTDHLFNVSESNIKKIKKDLGLPLDKKIILYTPTWRTKRKFEMEMEVEKMKKKLSDDYILLIRIHHLCSSNYDFEPDNKFSFDLTSYRTIEDLYLISDILITDYSSVMFDYALLDKPMIFFTYDLEDYRENLRGLYVDFEKEAPGPLVYDTKSIIDCINDINEYTEKYKEKINNFKNKYLTYENGNSSAKVVKEFIKPKFSLKRIVMKLKKR